MVDIAVDVQAALADFSGHVLVVGIVQSNGSPTPTPLSGSLAALDARLGGLIAEVRASGEAKGDHGEITVLHPQGRLGVARLVLVGLGKRPALTAERLRKAAGLASRVIRRTAAGHAGWLLPDQADTAIEPAVAAQAIVEGTLLGLYRFTTYLSEPPSPDALDQLTVLAAEDQRTAVEDGVRIGQAMAAGTITARDLVNEPPNVLTPIELASRATDLAARLDLGCEVLGPEEMREAGMGALLGVAAGSHQPPRLIVMRYVPAEPSSSEPPIGLIGKGITFDTGGISLKPGGDMYLMKGDMAGSAAVIGAMHVIGLLKPSRAVTAVIASAENMPGGAAQRPGDVVRAMNGTTIEVQNTDAEGRLVLADAVCYAVREGLSPLVDVATLTGAVSVALGPFYAGLFANGDAVADAVLHAAAQTGRALVAFAH